MHRVCECMLLADGHVPNPPGCCISDSSADQREERERGPYEIMRAGRTQSQIHNVNICQKIKTVLQTSPPHVLSDGGQGCGGLWIPTGQLFGSAIMCRALVLESPAAPNKPDDFKNIFFNFLCCTWMFLKVCQCALAGRQ